MKIGDIIPYKNTKGNIENVRIESFQIVSNGNVWFNGIDIRTNARVFYPLHVSIKLIKTNSEILKGLENLTNPSYNTGREGCTYSDTEYNSLDVCYGYNLAKEEVKNYVQKLIGN